MAYCGPRGIPLSTFLSWSPADQDHALSWSAHEAKRCRSCGYHPDEDDAAHAHIDVCPGCVVRDRTAGSEDAKARGAHVHLAKGPIADCARCQQESELN